MGKYQKFILVIFALALILVPTISPVFAVTENTQPTSKSIGALYLSNWKNMQAIWKSSQLNQLDNSNNGPRLGELHFSSDWSTNQIVDYSGFFRDETNAVKYDQIHGFSTNTFLDSNGILNSQYQNYNGSNLPVSISRNYAMVPNQNFVVVQYNIANTSASTISWNVLDQVHFANKNSSVNQNASYDAGRNAIINDMSASGQPFMALGALQAPTSYQVGNDSDSNVADAQAGAWYSFDNNGTLNNNSSVIAKDVDAAFQNTVSIPANSTATLYYYLVVDTSLSAIQSDIDAIRAQSGSYWFSQTRSKWTDWLNSGKRVNTTDTGINTTYDRNLIVMKDTQNPSSGAFPAATNPGAYGYYVWARDAAFSAMALDAAGHYYEAEQYWKWMASIQNTDGSFHTRFDLWTSENTNFVEPEHDSIGAFLLGVYNHIKLTGKSADDPFVTMIWPKIQLSANFVKNNINNQLSLGPADNSIWEENYNYWTFTQGMYVAGLNAAQKLALIENNRVEADNWSKTAGRITSGIQDNIWNTAGYFNQGINQSTLAPISKFDSSTDALFGWGALDPASSRASSHIKNIVNNLTHDTWGIARYSGDAFYYSSLYNPAGNESGPDSPEPVWPQMGNYVLLFKLYTGHPDEAFTRLQYYVQRSFFGYMPPGEAVSYYYQTPIVSTAAEPLTAASFIMSCLAYANEFDGRVIAPQYDAGTYQYVNVTNNAAGDWQKWSSVPYFVHQLNDTKPSDTHIKNVAISNDATNIYIRVDNTSGKLAGFNSTTRFAIQVYSEDYNHNTAATSSAAGMYGNLDRPMSYMAARWSDSNNYAKFHFSDGRWAYDYGISNVIAPQWDTNTGRIEMVIPISEFTSSGSVGIGSYAYLNIALIRQDPTTGQWTQDDLQPIHYRITSNTDSWIYGNTR